jgi:hypothetical protein
MVGIYRFWLLVAAMMIMASVPALAAEEGAMPEGMPPMPPPADFPGAVDAMLGEWEGTGDSTLGPYTCRWECERYGNYIVSLSRIYVEGMDDPIENMVQVFELMEDGRVEVHVFDGMGEAEFVGTADSKTATLRYEDGEENREFTWTVNEDGTITSSFSVHNPAAPPPFNDFHADDVSTRVDEDDDDEDED